MGKKSLERQLAANEAKAVINRIRISPRKLGLVAGLIRGMDVAQAITQLSFSSKRVANDVRRALQSAIANAENNHNLNVDSLYVKEAYVGKNIVMKRFHTRGRGKSAAIKKPFSNLTLIVRERGDTNPVDAKRSTGSAQKNNEKILRKRKGASQDAVKESK